MASNRRRLWSTSRSVLPALSISAICGWCERDSTFGNVKHPVEPSLGFAERLVRQLSELSKTPSVADFFERVGRRFVYATLVLTLLALLALTLPSTGPVRGLGAADIQISAQEASLAYSDPIGEAGVQESPDVAPVEAPAPAVTNEVK